MGEQWPPNRIGLSAGKRVLFLTKDLGLIRKQLYEGLDLSMEDIEVGDLLDDINTDVMTPAWVCFDHDPAIIAENAYAGLVHDGRRVFEPRALLDGGFEVIVSGHRKGTGSSRVLFQGIVRALARVASQPHSASVGRESESSSQPHSRPSTSVTTSTSDN